MGIPRYHKVFALGHRTIQNILKGEVEITEKVDGSQFGFGKVEGDLYCRSRGQALILEAPEKMFKSGVDYVKSMWDKIPNNHAFYGEFLRQPKHNTLVYDSIPKGGIALFGGTNLITQEWYNYSQLKAYAATFGIDMVPLIYQGIVNNPEDIIGMLDRVSFLGGENIEGVVVKNYTQDNMIGGAYIPFLAGKYVSERFKERHNTRWKTENTGKGKLQAFVESFKSEARWNKAIIHMREAGELKGAPEDIGSLIRGIHQDIIDEEIDEIKDFFWKLHKKQLMSAATRGFPEWYKEKLLKGEVGE